MKTWIRRLAVAAVASFGFFNVYAQSQSGPMYPAIFQLGGAFEEESVSIASDLCTARVPSSRVDWIETFRQWHEAHREKLTSLGQAVRSLEVVLEKSPEQGAPLNLGQFAMFRAQGPQFIMYGLAGADDIKAYALCAKLRAKLLDRTQEDRLLDQAQLAVSTALMAVSKN